MLWQLRSTKPNARVEGHYTDLSHKSVVSVCVSLVRLSSAFLVGGISESWLPLTDSEYRPVHAPSMVPRQVRGRPNIGGG